MGVFSWKTQNTDRSIYNVMSSVPTIHVVMVDNNNNHYFEKYYEGYGEFGGKDFYELLAEMNGLTTRSEGIDLAYSGKPYLTPNLYEVVDGFVPKWKNEIPRDCPNQGYTFEDAF